MQTFISFRLVFSYEPRFQPHFETLEQLIVEFDGS